MADEGIGRGGRGLHHAGEGEGQGRLISLHNWIAINGRLEELQARSGPDDAAGRIEAQLSYFGRGAILALLIVEDLVKGGAGLSLSGVSPDEIQIRVGYVGRTDGLSETPETLLESLESVMGMEIIPSGQSERAGGEEEETIANTLRRVGQILFPIFSRGRPLPIDLTKANGNNVARGGGEKDPCSRAAMRTRQDDSQDEEFPGPEGKGRQKRSLGGGSCKSKRGSNSSVLDESLSGLGLPLSLQLLLGGLLDPTEGAQFRSLTDVCRELHQITDRPDTFLHDKLSGTLDFAGQSIIGRGAEMSRLVEAALRVQHANRDAAHTNTFVGISGEAGSGKSFLVESMHSALVDRGWIFLSCKFDRLMQSQPLATIAAGFEPFFEHVAEVASQGADVEFITDPVRNNLSASGIVVLSDFMPSLQALFPFIFESIVVDSTEVLSEQSNVGNSAVGGGSVDVIPDDDNDDIISGTGSRSNRLHYLFRCLIQSISSPERPILLFLDDLQWCDETGLGLLGSILMDVDHLGDDERDTQRLCVVGTYRTNTENNCLPVWLEKIKESSTMNVENIAIEKMPLSDSNLVISEVLGLSERHTRELTQVAYTKTLGNVLCLREFLRNLVDEEILYFSLADKRWRWEIDEVKFMSFDDDIANLVTKKIIRMPADVQRALTVASCFGARLEESSLRIMIECERFQDIIPRLEFATQEGMMGKEGQSFRFPHDMVQQAGELALSLSRFLSGPFIDSILQRTSY